MRSIAAGICCAWSLAALAGDYRFESPDVLDVSVDRTLRPLLTTDVPATPLAPDIAAAIIGEPEVGNEAPGQLPMLDGSDKVARKAEKARIAAQSALVERAGKTLTIRTASGKTAEFRDRPPPVRNDADADGELFIYAGRIGASGYHRVEERFQQDAPGSYLVAPGDDKTVFVPNGSYVEQLSPDGKWLLSMSPGDTRVLLVVLALDADAPRVALMCDGNNVKNAGPGTFKGWRDASTFDVVLNPLVLAPGTPGQGAATVVPTDPIALRFVSDAKAWHPTTPRPEKLAELGYVCRR